MFNTYFLEAEGGPTKNNPTQHFLPPPPPCSGNHTFPHRPLLLSFYCGALRGRKPETAKLGGGLE